MKRELIDATIEAGGSPAASYFSCSAKKSNPKKAAPGSSALRAALRYSRVKAAAELALRAQTVLADGPFTRCVARRLARYFPRATVSGDSMDQMKSCDAR